MARSSVVGGTTEINIFLLFWDIWENGPSNLDPGFLF
jgi:hypothetical protein